MLVDQYAFHDEDGGAGEYRGGKGIVLDYRVRGEEAQFTGSFGRYKFPPWGAAGGQNGSPNYSEVLRGGKPSEPREIHSKPARVVLKRGDVIRTVTATGGGWGDPRRRSDTALAEDLKNGFVTQEQLRKYYRPA